MTRKRNSRPVHQDALVDVVVTTAGRFDMLTKCLSRLDVETLIPINIIVFDNGSPAEERIVNESLFTGRNTKRLPNNIGFPAACNEAARMGKAPLILFLSDDVILDDDAISSLVGSMDDPTIGIVGTKLLFPEDSHAAGRPAGKVQHIGLAVDISGNIIHPLIGWNKDNPKTCVTRDVFAVTGGSLMIRRSLFSKAGGFDTVFGKGTYEDVNLCLTVRQMGSRIILDANAIGHHYVGATAEKRQEPFPLGINAMIFKSKWMPTGLVNWDLWTFYA